MADVHGRCDAKFEKVRDAFGKNFDKGFEVGASVAITIDGELVVDMWGGHTDMERTQPWQEDTITNVWSSTKTMMFLTLVYLADKGELSLYDKVAKFWPEFAQNGKENIEIRHLMAHTSGLSGFDAPMTHADYEDFEKCASLLAAQAPWWEPGTASGYHAINQGFPIGEVVRRITGETMGTFFRKNIAGPLNADFHIGTGPEHDARSCFVILPTDVPAMELEPDSIAFKTFVNPPMDPSMALTIGWRRAEIGAANGHGNARSMAKVQTLMSNRGVSGGVRLMSENAPKMVFDEQSNGVDLVIGVPVRFGMGYALNSEPPMTPSPNTCFWGGWGGSMVVNDLDRRMTFCYLMNRMYVGSDSTIGDDRGQSLVTAAYESL